MFKPLVPPEVWETLRQEAMAVPHRLIDPERVDIWTSERQTRVALRRSPLRPMPLMVLTRGHSDVPGGRFVEQEEELWLQLQRELAQLVPGSRHVITQSGHNIHQEQPELVLDAIRDGVLAVRVGDLVPLIANVRLHPTGRRDIRAPSCHCSRTTGYLTLTLSNQAARGPPLTFASVVAPLRLVGTGSDARPASDLERGRLGCMPPAAAFLLRRNQ